LVQKYEKNAVANDKWFFCNLSQLYLPSFSAYFPDYTGCLIKNASTHNFFIYYPISMNKKTKDMVFHALQNSHKIYFFLALFSIANDSQLFFLNGHM
jgi:hypothetical protein